MQVLLLDKMTYRVERCLLSLIEAGIDVLGSGSVAVADAVLRRGAVDVLVITAEAAGKGTRQLINTAEQRNPNVATILLAADVERASAIAAQSLPSVHCTLSTDCSPEQILRFAMASLPRPAARSEGDFFAPEPEIGPEIGSEMGPQSGPMSGPMSGSVSGLETTPATGAQTGAQTGPEIGPETGAKTGPVAGPERPSAPQPETRSVPEPRFEKGPQMHPEMATPSAAPAQPGAVPEPDAGSEAPERAVFTTSRKRRSGPPTARAA